MGIIVAKAFPTNYFIIPYFLKTEWQTREQLSA
jgi:hypothetical protein